ncbi:response regulator transcription factor [Marinomonas polaris]|uniref:response regulator transcription factor n=1 Tax=Marinomonas polaris TaxID=293552 RepID=UPI001DBAEF0B|nr:response regulator transcription factor [Gammaproteobacteria bacterium]MBU1464772.1 response regulator transcription factor [Gammaproteobacteria bacterium]MBU2024360.1 response regulator transcription factor [Gammaproteobacteria bacterium]MBU2237167.1 response regulator transcription factor [Gammaproteobacteria bacterium]
MRILVVEDDASVSHWISSKLHVSGHICKLVDNGEDALKLIKKEVFDVILLDRVLPKLDGIQLLGLLGNTPHPPILILSANDQISDRIEGLRAGADDYLGKPFDFTELLLRLERLYFRTKKVASSNLIKIKDMMINLELHEVTRSGQKIDLTNKEFKLLYVLAEHPGQTVTRSMLLEKAWGYHFDPQTNILDVHLSKLRHKLDGGSNNPIIRTIRSVGYALG